MNEEDIKNKIIVPYLNTLGFEEDELNFEYNFTLQLGRNIFDNKEIRLKGRADILVKYNAKNFLIFELKAENINIDKNAIEQGLSYARLLKEIPPYTIISNGGETKIFDSISGIEVNEIDKDKKISIKDAITLRFDALKNVLSYSPENLFVFTEKFSVNELKKLENTKYKKDLYVIRHKYREIFKEYIESDKKILLVYGNSGAGKTNLLCDLYYYFQNNLISMFYNSGYIDKSIVDKIKQDFNFGFSEQYELRTIFERLEQIGNIKNKKIMIYIDALDEMKIDNPVIKVDELLSIIKQFKNIKLCLSCKTSFIESLNSINGIDSEFKLMEKDEIELKNFEQEEINKLIIRYSDFFNVKIEDNIIYRFKEIKDGFLFRLIFEANEGKTIDSNTSLDDIDIIERYLKKICENNNWNILDFKNVLKKLAEFYINANEKSGFYLEIDENDIYESLNGKNIGLQDLYDKYILEKTEIYGKFNSIEFYYKPICYYCITILLEKINCKYGDELKNTLNRLDKNRRTSEAIEWYGVHFNIEQIQVIKEYKKEKLIKYLNGIRAIINKDFKILSSKFECNTDINKIGIGLLDGEYYAGVTYFFFIKDSDDDLKVFNHRPKFGEVKTGNSMTIYSKINNLSPEEYVFEKINKMVNNVNLNEFSCIDILQEEILLLIMTYSDKFKYATFKREPTLLIDYNAFKFPINVKELKKCVEDAIDNDYLFLNKHCSREMGTINEYRYSVLNSENKYPIFSNDFNKNIVYIYNLLNEYLNRYGETIDCIPYSLKVGNGKIRDEMSIIERQFSDMDDEDIKTYYCELYKKIIENYKNIIEFNFHGIENMFEMYSNIKKGLSIKIYIYKNKDNELNKKDIWLRHFSINKEIYTNNTGTYQISCEVNENFNNHESFFSEHPERIKASSGILSDIYEIDNNDLKDNLLGKNKKYAIIRNAVYKLIIDDLKNISRNKKLR